MASKRDEECAQVIFDYMKLNQPIKKSSVIVVLGSIDTLPAERGADLFLDGWGYLGYIVFTGGAEGRNYEKATEETQGLTEADMLAEVAYKMGVPKSRALLERKSKNTGQNITFARELLHQNNIYPQSMIAVHMPSSERRDYATIKKVWPEIELTMASPRVPFSEYHIRGYQGQMSRDQLIADLIGDFQRTFVYSRPEFGFMVPQDKPLPNSVREAYQELIKDNFYKDHLLKYKDGEKEGRIIEI